MDDTLHVGDFVQATTKTNRDIAGVIVKRVECNGRPDILRVEEYDGDGATGIVRAVEATSADLHPIGRVSVMESISNTAQDETYEE